MGVTTHFFAFDPRVYTTAPTIDRWVAQGELGDDLEVLDQARASLKPIHSWLGDNKRWYDNLAGDHAWACAREHVAPELRAALDHWFSHLFWDADEQGCACARCPVEVAEHELIFDHALLEHIVSLERSLLPVEAALALEFDGDPPKTARVHEPWVYDFDGFAALVGAWQKVFEEARKAGPGWSLLRWVWY